MESTGNEQRIKALFSQLRLDDQQVAPRFGVLFNRAPAAANQPQSGFKLSFALAAALVCVIAAITWWGTSRLNRTTSPAVAGTTSPALIVPSAPQNTSPIAGTTSTAPAVKPKTAAIDRSRLVARVLASRRRNEIVAANKKALQEAQAISTWQSPTSSLLSSSSGEVLTTLPQLNENATQLKSFLPGNAN